MGFYIKKAISVGPFRFNLSKSGIGVSAGITGLRFGTGPRGNYVHYVHMGRNGIYYRKTLPSGSSKEQYVQEQSEYQKIHSDDQVEMKEIESADIEQLFDSSSAELVSEMNEKRSKARIWPWIIVFGLLVSYFVHQANSSFTGYFLVFIALLTYFVSIKDELRKTIVLFYELDEDVEKLYDKLHTSFKQISSASQTWHISAEGKVSDQKRNAGATSLIERNSIALSYKSPPYVKTNVTTPSIPVGKQTLYFFPDKVLVFEEDKVGAVSYENLHISISSQRFIEHESVPRDAKVVDKTWKYVNKRGGPDKRFNDNKELPICLYEDMHFKSASGLNELIEISKLDASANFGKAIVELGQLNTQEGLK